MKTVTAMLFLLLAASAAYAQQFEPKPMHFGPPIASPPPPQQQPQTVFAPNGQTATIHDNGAMGKTVIAPNGKIYNVQ